MTNTSTPIFGRRLTATTAAVALALGVGLTGCAAHPTQAAPHQVAAHSVVDGRPLLLGLADLAARTAPETPQPDQFTYSRTKEIQFVVRSDGDGRENNHDDGTVTREVWSPQDPSRTGLIRQPGQPDLPYGRGQADTGIDLTSYTGLEALPTDDPATLLTDIASTIGNSDDPSDSTGVQVMKVLANGGLFGQVLPPHLAAAAYRALATILGITRQDGVTDLDGRPAVAVGLTDTHGEHYDVLFDPATAQALGTRTYPIAEGPDTRADFPVGVSGGHSATAFLQVGIADAAGEQPRS